MTYLKVYLRDNIMANLALVGASLFLGLIVYQLNPLMNQVYSKGIVEGNLGVFHHEGLLLMVIYCLIAATAYCKRRLNYRVHWQGMMNFKLSLSQEMIASQADYLMDRTPSGVWNDMNLISFELSKFYKSITALIARLIEGGLLTLLVFKISFEAGCIMSLLMPGLALVNLWTNKKITRVQRQLIQLSREASIVNNEAIESVEVIKTYKLHDFFINRLRKNARTLHKQLTTNSILIAYWETLSNLVMSIAMVTFIYFVSLQETSASLDLGQIMVLYTLMPLMAGAYRDVFALGLSYAGVKPSMDRAKLMTNLDQDQLGHLSLETFESLETKGLMVKRGSKSISIPDMTIKSGDWVLLSGPSGCGKSTLLRILLGLIHDYQGEVFINGRKLNQYATESLRQVFGLAFQEAGVFTMNLEDNVCLGQSELEDYHKLISHCQLSELATDKGASILSNKNLSGGEKSRISLGQTLYKKPQVVLIDESLSNLHQALEEVIMDTLAESYGDKTLIVVSHRQSTSRYYNQHIKFQSLSSDQEEIA